jgi:hypothetical protein
MPDDHHCSITKSTLNRIWLTVEKVAAAMKSGRMQSSDNLRTKERLAYMSYLITISHMVQRQGHQEKPNACEMHDSSDP